MIDFLNKWAFLAPIGILCFAIINYIKNRKNPGLKQKQIDSVISLVDEIQKTVFTVSFQSRKGRGAGGNTYSLTLFEIADMTKQNKEPDFKEAKVYFPKGSNQLFDIKGYIDTSTMPKKIAHKLEIFYVNSYEKINMDDIDTRINVVGLKTDYFQENTFNKEIDERADVLKIGNSVAYQTWNSFGMSCIRLKKEIENFGKKNNLDINFRVDYKTR